LQGGKAGLPTLALDLEPSCDEAGLPTLAAGTARAFGRAPAAELFGLACSPAAEGQPAASALDCKRRACPRSMRSASARAERRWGMQCPLLPRMLRHSSRYHVRMFVDDVWASFAFA